MISPKQYMYDLMRDKSSGLTSRCIKYLLLPLSYIYGLLITCHNFLYGRGLMQGYKASVPVISVGNITLGGTGKTPFVVMLAELLTTKSKKPAVLIRGYGEDEWVMLQDKLKKCDIEVFVGRDRVKSSIEAGNRGASGIILDDGFQHRRLARNLDIVLLDSTNPFGNMALFPRGILREPASSLRRAHVIVLTKADKGKKSLPALEREIAKIAPGKIIAKAIHKPFALLDPETGEVKGLSAMSKKTVCLVSAVCDGSYFRYTMENIGAMVGLEFIFPDHHDYRKRELKNILKACQTKGISDIVTTEKDYAKLKNLPFATGKVRILVLGIEMEITDGKEKLHDEIDRLYMRYNS
ncbi:MAG: tetraacyldisaccharide 4'-kinase [Candidatus Omnitrophica bacterium]|nr:tetraacyldisaccharide 4'-kinase [Candidatus Omnitrophota bacterium]